MWQFYLGGNMMIQEWNGFKKGVWETEINVRDFIQKNYTPYDGDDSFLAGPTKQHLNFGNRF